MSMVDELPLFSRRGFVRFCAVGAAVVTGGLASPAAGATSKAKEFPAGRFVDVHTHLGQTWNTTTELTATNLLKWMDAHDVAEAVVLPLVSPESSSFLLTTEFVLAQRSCTGTGYFFCCIDPRTSFSGGRNGLASMLRQCT